MCTRHARPGQATADHVFSPLLSTPGEPAPGTRIELAGEPAQAGSRRTRLWELDAHAHCPVVGVCLPIDALRKLLPRLMPDVAACSDYDMHCLIVTASKARNPVSEALQKELDRRFAATLARSLKARTQEALQAWWREMSVGHDLPGALWATLSHPRCDGAFTHQVLGEVHMRQHQVGVDSRVDHARMAALARENAALQGELTEARSRAQRAARETIVRLDALEADRLRLRAQLVTRDSLLAQQREAQAEAEAAMPSLRQRLELAQENERLHAELRRMQRAVAAAVAEADTHRARADRLAREAESPADMPAAARPVEGAEVVVLDSRSVLCVGGRQASVPAYRQVVERHGGRFLHHDGGEAEGTARLDDTLGAADLVLCQTGCISHGAYWRVKDHCKRTGKRCVFIESPSRSALERALREATAEPVAGPVGMNVRA